MSINKNYINAKSILTISLIIFGVVFLYMNVTQLNELWLEISFYYLCWAVFLAILAIILSAYKFKLTIDLSLNKDVLFKDWLNIFVKTYILNSFIPYSGIAYRGLYLKKNYDISYTDYLGVTYLFGFVGLALLLGTAICLLALIHNYFAPAAILFVILILTVKYKFYFLKKISTLNLKHAKANFFLQKLGTLHDKILAIINSKKKFLFLLIFFSSLSIDFFVYGCVFHVIENDVSWHSMIYVYLPYTLGWLIRITPGNIGVQEFLMGAVAAIVGMNSINGVVLSILLRLVNLVAAFTLWILHSITLRK